MFIPLRDYLPRATFPTATLALIGLNVFFYLLTSGDMVTATANVMHWGVVPYELMHGGTQCDVAANLQDVTCGPAAQVQAAHPGVFYPPAWLTVISSMFMHGGLMHLLGNMLFLFVFGRGVEDALGRLNYVLFYVVGGLAAVFAQVMWDSQSTVPMVGASGAIAAVLAAYLVLFPSARVLSLFIIFPVKPRAFWVIGTWIALQLLDAWFAAGGEQTDVAVFAHIGGFVVGAALTLLLVDSDERRRFHELAKQRLDLMPEPQFVPVAYPPAPYAYQQFPPQPYGYPHQPAQYAQPYPQQYAPPGPAQQPYPPQPYPGYPPT